MSREESRFEAILKNVKEIPALPDVAVRVMRMTRDADVTANQLTEVISQDPGLTGNILRLCNSAYYGLPRVISSLSQAIMYLGFHTVRNLVLTCTICDLLGSDRTIYGHGAGGLWTNSFACAVASQQIAYHIRPSLHDTAFTAGLLRDIGKVVIHRQIKDTESTLIELMTRANLSLLEAEQQTLGYTHPEVGAALADRWNFPRELVDAIQNHHYPSVTPEGSLVTVIVHAADVMVIERGYGVELTQIRYALDRTATEQKQITQEILDQVAAELDQHIASIRELLIPRGPANP
jgi:putative nucleotidyltransferase with HDIG domain